MFCLPFEFVAGGIFQFVTIVLSSAGSIFDISKYHDTCKSSIPILSGIAILLYFGIERPLFDTFDTFDTSTESPFDDVDAKAQDRCQ